MKMKLTRDLFVSRDGDDWDWGTVTRTQTGSSEISLDVQESIKTTCRPVVVIRMMATARQVIVAETAAMAVVCVIPVGF